METNETRQPYSAPQLTRIVLRREQAILSACSTATTSPKNNSGMLCADPSRSGTNACRRTSFDCDSSISGS